jgi:hypothetical protein
MHMYESYIYNAFPEGLAYLVSRTTCVLQFLNKLNIHRAVHALVLINKLLSSMHGPVHGQLKKSTPIVLFIQKPILHTFLNIRHQNLRQLMYYCCSCCYCILLLCATVSQYSGLIWECHNYWIEWAINLKHLLGEVYGSFWLGEAFAASRCSWKSWRMMISSKCLLQGD